MDVLLSVKPHFVDSIFNGTKKYEYRKNIFRRTDIQKVIIYASSPIKKIIGEFRITQVIWDKPEAIWLRTGNSSGIKRELFYRYFKGKEKGYAIGIKNVKKYELPFDPLDVFLNFTPPQSFMYIDSNKLENYLVKPDIIMELVPDEPTPIPFLVPSNTLAF